MVWGKSRDTKPEEAEEEDEIQFPDDLFNPEEYLCEHETDLRKVVCLGGGLVIVCVGCGQYRRAKEAA